MTTQTSPFVAGAQVVAVRIGSRGGRLIDKPTLTVDKVRANGNFTVAGSPQQYRPLFHCAFLAKPGDGRWIAEQTGGEKYAVQTVHVEIFDDKIIAELATQAIKVRRFERLAALQKKMNELRLVKVTDAQLDALESAMNAAVQS